MRKSSLSEDEYRLCVQVARLYYESDLTQDEIGERLGYSRVKINRILQQARNAGIVEIRITAPPDSFDALESSLMVRYGLRGAVVVPEKETSTDLYSALARGAADWLHSRLVPGMRVGIGMGRTVSYLPQFFAPQKPIECTFTEVVGAASDHSGGLASYNIVAKMAELSKGRTEFFYAPTFVLDSGLKNQLLAEPSVIQALERARSCDIILQSVGVVDETALMYIHQYFDQQDLANLRALGAVGDALGHYYNANGQHVPSFADDRIIGLDLEDIQKTPWSVVLAGGSNKIAAILGALRGKYFNVLVTDRATAVALLEDTYAA